MNRRSKTVLGGMSVLCSAALALAACGFGGSGDDSSAADGQTTVSFLAPTYSDGPDGTKALWDKIISDFESKNPNVDVVLEMQSWDTINDVLRTKLQSQDTTPDILNIDAYAEFAKDGQLFEAKDVVSESVLRDFDPGFAANASLDGVQYGLPIAASTRVLFYNKDLFAQAGVDGPPKTWDELLAAAQKISALGNGIAGYGLPLGNEEAQAETSIWTFGAGGSWGDDSELTIDTPQNLAGVEQMKKMIDADVTQPNAGSTDRKDVINNFVQGKIGMIEAHPPTVGLIEQGNPGLQYATAPSPTESGSPVTLGVADHLMAFEKDGTKATAIKAFLDYFYSTDVYADFVKSERFIPCTISAGEVLADDPVIEPFLAVLPAAKFYPSNNPNWAAAQGAIQQNMGTIGQGESPSDVLGIVAEAAKLGN